MPTPTRAGYSFTGWYRDSQLTDLIPVGTDIVTSVNMTIYAGWSALPLHQFTSGGEWGSIGPYVLHDFFLYHFMRYGATPEKIKYIALQVFDGMYDEETITKWLKFFIKRFFNQQNKLRPMLLHRSFFAFFVFSLGEKGSIINLTFQ